MMLSTPLDTSRGVPRDGALLCTSWILLVTWALAVECEKNATSSQNMSIGLHCQVALRRSGDRQLSNHIEVASKCLLNGSQRDWIAVDDLSESQFALFPLLVTNTSAMPSAASVREAKAARVTIVSGGNNEREWTPNVTDNHERFAALQGYHYRYVNMSDWAEVSGGKEAQWLKVHALLETLRSSESEFVLWVDDDIVFTSNDAFVERMIIDIEDKCLLIARDIRLDQVNTGVMLVRKNEEAERLLEDLWMKSESDLGYCKEQSCFHEQEALNRMILSGEACAQVVNPVNHKYNVNTMWRRSHYDESRKASFSSGRNMYLDYDENDPPSQRWQWGMNTAHVSGMTPSCRAPMLKWMAEYAKRFVFGSERDEAAFRETNPYTSRCQQHLGRKVQTRFSDLGRPRAEILLSKFSYGGGSARTALPSIRASVPEDGNWSNTSRSEGSVSPLVVVMESLLPDLLDGAVTATRLDLHVNCTQVDALERDDKEGENLSLSLFGQLVISDAGSYDFVAESANVSDGAGVKSTDESRTFRDMRLQSGRIALSAGGLNLSVEFSLNRDGAGLMFNYFWHDRSVAVTNSSLDVANSMRSCANNDLILT